MKKIYLYVAFALASIGMISCTDILDQDPLDSFTDEAVWNDLALSETYLNAQYTLIPQHYYKYNFLST